MKELDELLVRFLDTGYAESPPRLQQAFARLLELQDPELYALLCGRTEATDDPDAAEVVERIRYTARH